jgi:hypothetical protein
MSVTLLALILAAGVVIFVLRPVIAGKEAPIDRKEEEITDLQHRKKVSLLALRDVEYDFHAGKLDEVDYLAMKRDLSAEALRAIDAEEMERAGHLALGSSRGSDLLEAEIASLRASIRDGIVCPECGWPNPRGSRFCGDCGSALPRSPGVRSEERGGASVGRE